MEKTDDTLELFMKRLTEAQPSLERFVTGALVAHIDDVRDIVQNTNCKLIAHARDYRSDLDFLPWAITFAKNEIRTYRKKQSRERLVFDDELLDTYEKSAFTGEPESADESLCVKALYACLKKLPERERDLISEHYLKANPLVRLAAREHKPESTLRVALFRARQALADCMKRFCRLSSGELEVSSRPSAFSNLLTRAIDSEHPGSEAVAALLDSLRAEPADMAVYADQLDVHFLLTKQVKALGVPQTAERISARSCGWLKAAAILVVLLGLFAYAYHALTAVAPVPAPAVPEPVAVPAAEPDAVTATTNTASTAVAIPAAEPDAAVATTNTASTAAAIPAAVHKETQGESTVKTNRPAREAIAAVALAAAVSAVQATAPLSAEAYQPVGSGDSGASVLDTRTGTGAVAGEIPIDARTGTELDSAAGPLNTTEIKGTIYSFR